MFLLITFFLSLNIYKYKEKSYGITVLECAFAYGNKNTKTETEDLEIVLKLNQPRQAPWDLWPYFRIWFFQLGARPGFLWKPERLPGDRVRPR